MTRRSSSRIGPAIATAVLAVWTQASGAPAPRPTFPPRDVSVLGPKSAAPGDGLWVPFGDASRNERAAATPPLIVKTVLHPHPESHFITVTVAAIDLTRVGLVSIPGTLDVEWAKINREGAGLVPAGSGDAVVAVMNGGFQPKHGHWGMMAEGVTVEKPREDGCTLALYADGSVRLAPWPAIAASPVPPRSFRQTPPCLVDAGAVHPSLLANHDHAWAGHAADLATRRRSAIGLDASGTVLFYAIGEEASPRWLAEGLRLAGAVTAAEFDINWYWTRFLLFGDAANGDLDVTSTLIPKMEHARGEYLRHASTRDFFALVRKPAP